MRSGGASGACRSRNATSAPRGSCSALKPGTEKRTTKARRAPRGPDEFSRSAGLEHFVVSRPELALRPQIVLGCTWPEAHVRQRHLRALRAFVVRSSLY